MDVIEAIRFRHSVRDFKPDPVPKDILIKILEAALYSPSAGNSQPWQMYVVGGDVLENIRQAYLERFEKEVPGKPDIPTVSPTQWSAVMSERMKQTIADRLKLLKIDPQDKAAMRTYQVRGPRFFRAPVLVILCMDRTLTVASTIDFGLVSQTIMLAAKSYGVDSIMATAFVIHPDILRKELDMPDNLLIVTGIGLGYPNPEDVLNTYRSPRALLKDLVSFKGL